MQGDGRMQIFDGSGQSVFMTDSYGRTNAYLIVQNDGNAVNYDAYNQPVWAATAEATVSASGELGERLRCARAVTARRCYDQRPRLSAPLPHHR